MQSGEADVLSANTVGEAALALYGAAGRLATPLAGALLRRRERRGKEDPKRRGERFGVPGRDRPEGPLVWVHAASVGETVAVLPLSGRISASGCSVLLTTGTVTAAQIAERQLPANAIHQFAPIDTPDAVARFLDHWRPGLVLFAESELWPTMLSLLQQRSVPLAVVNARMSDRSARAWGRLPPLATAVISRVTLFLAQTPADADRLRGLGANRVVMCGNLKFDVPPPPADAVKVASLRAGIAGRPVLVAASTHPGEEGAIIAAHAELARDGAPLLTILAPRHPERGGAIAQDVVAAGLRATRRSLGEPVSDGVDIHVADTIGEMGLWYRVADVAFLGGSMVARGGQNPIEAVKLHVPVLHGGHVSNFQDVYDALAKGNAVRMASDAASLAKVLRALIQDVSERERLARAALDCIARFEGALEQTLLALQPQLASLQVQRAASA